jgi:hypothetical protein
MLPGGSERAYLWIWPGNIADDSSQGAMGSLSGRFLNGGLVHGISTFVAGGFFSSAYMAVRPYGYLPSYLSSYTAHMTHNCLVMFVLPVLMPNLG